MPKGRTLRLLTAVSAATWSAAPGQVVGLDEFEKACGEGSAGRFVAKGLAEFVGVETATAPEAPERTVSRGSRKRPARGKGNGG